MIDKRGGAKLGEFARLIKRQREKLGLTVKDVSKYFLSKTGGLTGCLWNWENGTNVPTIDEYNKLIKILKMDDMKELKEAEREIIGRDKNWGKRGNVPLTGYKEFDITTPTTPEAKHFDGWFGGFQPKPTVEIILVCMKPLDQKTYVDQALANEKGCVNFNACRIPGRDSEQIQGNSQTLSQVPNRGGGKIYSQNLGRFPANLLVSDNVLDDAKNHISGKMECIAKKDHSKTVCYGKYNPHPAITHKSEGGFSRFFSLDAWWNERIKQLPKSIQKTFPFLICSKASKVEKNRGCEGLPEKERRTMGEGLKGKSGDRTGQGEYTEMRAGENKMSNNHPTCKPIKLFSWLIVLASRQGDIVCDPFLGSGTTCLAAKMLGRKYIGFEKESEYYDIAKARINHEDFLF